MQKKLFNKKTGKVIFFSQNWFVNFSEYTWIFSEFYLIFENPVCQKVFSKKKNIISKIRRKSERIDMFSDKPRNQFWLKERLGYRFGWSTKFGIVKCRMTDILEFQNYEYKNSERWVILFVYFYFLKLLEHWK